ncbi:alpha/beta fold hydrolase [Chloroflexus aggregans]|uniref:Alpha/beta hydrolase fold protein n=1 Tax=Chloroflexus aggregans (strain MD-66 / DSM 9485) TaxID=326427 RepID=B8G3Z2_CHLAD|nr:alpha/beta hydrolase [Chloroflexus aggregans]ACL25394.1 alpha/beta hydrolase fold protein [Chloroflexus aggregans DSM 9485]
MITHSAAATYRELGGYGPRLIHIAPANGFPPEAYVPLAAGLAPLGRIIGYRPRPLRVDGDAEPGGTWRDLAAELITDLQAVASQPVIGIGHSLGGILTLYAAVARPDLFQGLVLIDPVLFRRRLQVLIWLLRKSGQGYRFPLAQGALRRRDHFASIDEARQRWQGRGVFADFTPDALEGYLNGGLRPHGNGYTLAWPKRWESHIFASSPIDAWRDLRRLQRPLLIVRGTRSELITDSVWKRLQRVVPHAALAEVEAGHMVPMERPADVTAIVADWVQRL